MSDEKLPVTISDKDEARRIQCENGHSSVDWTNNHWWCPMCAKHWDEVDAEYETVVDKKTDRRLRREDVVFDIDDESVPI